MVSSLVFKIVVIVYMVLLVVYGHLAVKWAIEQRVYEAMIGFGGVLWLVLVGLVTE